MVSKHFYPSNCTVYCIVLYCIVLYCIVLYCIALHCIASHRIVSYRIVSYRIASHRIASHRIVLYCIVLYCMVLYCIVLYLSGSPSECNDLYLCATCLNKLKIILHLFPNKHLCRILFSVLPLFVLFLPSVYHINTSKTYFLIDKTNKDKILGQAK